MPRRHRAVLGLAEVDVAGCWRCSSPGRRRRSSGCRRYSRPDVALFPRRHLRLDRRGSVPGLSVKNTQPDCQPQLRGRRGDRGRRRPCRPGDDRQADAAVLRRIADDAGDAIVGGGAAADHRQRAAEHVGGAVALQRSFSVSTADPGRASAVRGLPAREGEAEHVEQRPVDHQHVLDRRRHAVLEDGRSAAERIDELADLREILPEPRARDIGRHLQQVALAGRARHVMRLELIAVLDVGQRPVVAELVADVEQDQQARGHADRQPQDVDQRIGAVLHQRPHTDGQIVAPHCLGPTRSEEREWGDPGDPDRLAGDGRDGDGEGEHARQRERPRG